MARPAGTAREVRARGVQDKKGKKRVRGDWVFAMAVGLDVVDVDFLLAAGAAIIGLLLRVGLAELEVGLAVLALAEAIGLVDLGVLGQLAVRLEGAGLVGRVLEDDVALAVLEFAQREEDDIALVDPDLLAHLAADLFGPSY